MQAGSGEDGSVSCEDDGTTSVERQMELEESRETNQRT